MTKQLADLSVNRSSGGFSLQPLDSYVLACGEQGTTQEAYPGVKRLTLCSQKPEKTRDKYTIQGYSPVIYFLQLVSTSWSFRYLPVKPQNITD